MRSESTNFLVNVLYNDEDTHAIMPLRISNRRGQQHHVNLFCLYDDSKKQEDESSKPLQVTETARESNPEVDFKEVAEAESKFHYITDSHLYQYLSLPTKSMHVAFINSRVHGFNRL